MHNHVGARVFSPARDEVAAAAMVAHNHTTLQTLRGHVDALVTVVSARGESLAATRYVLDGLLDWCRGELLPHARAEESTLYRTACVTEQGTMLVEAMLEEHRTIVRTVEDLARVADPVRAVAVAGALEALVAGHLAKENDQLLPLLVRSPYIALAEALDGLEELVGLERDAVRP